MANAVDLSATLQNAQSADAHARQQAEIQLQQFQQQDYPSYLLSLATELSKEQSEPSTRQMAGVIFKNSVDAPSETKKVRVYIYDRPADDCTVACKAKRLMPAGYMIQAELVARWNDLPPAVKAQIRQLLLGALPSEVCQGCPCMWHVNITLTCYIIGHSSFHTWTV